MSLNHLDSTGKKSIFQRIFTNCCPCLRPKASHFIINQNPQAIQGQSNTNFSLNNITNPQPMIPTNKQVENGKKNIYVNPAENYNFPVGLEEITLKHQNNQMHHKKKELTMKPPINLSANSGTNLKDDRLGNHAEIQEKSIFLPKKAENHHKKPIFSLDPPSHQGETLISPFKNFVEIPIPVGNDQGLHSNIGGPLEEINCENCAKVLSLLDLDYHECLCIFCREAFPSNLLSEHFPLCPIKSNLEHPNRVPKKPARTDARLENLILHESLENGLGSLPRRPESSVPMRNSPFQARILQLPQEIRGENDEIGFGMEIFGSGREQRRDEINRVLPQRPRILLNHQRIVSSNIPGKLDKKKIQSLPILSYHMKEEEGKEEDKCMICMEEFLETENLRVLTCFHKYHVSCIDQWLEMKGICPVCKQPINI